jgi:hypothetical protein
MDALGSRRAPLGRTALLTEGRFFREGTENARSPDQPRRSSYNVSQKVRNEITRRS